MRSRPRRAGPEALVKFVSTLFKLAAIAGIVLLLVLAAAVSVVLTQLPSYGELRRSPVGQTVQLLAADGSPLVTVGPSYGRWLAFSEIPPAMAEAMLAVEDRRFWRHPGIDPIGVGRALKVRVEEGRFTEGASTITQQLARNIFLTNTRTFDRKLREAVVALAMEQKFTKEQILELYLNRVYFGGGAYGVDAASRRFFGHPAGELDTAKAAVIAGLVKAPSRYAPSADPERARARAATVVAVMADAGAITAAEANAAAAAVRALRFVSPPRAGEGRYFADWVLAELDQLTDETVAPLVVHTTLDPRMQAAAEAAEAAAGPASAQMALVAMDRAGAVKAMVGGRDYAASNYNRATTAQRQPGSSFKLFVYAAALEDGFEPDTVVRDEPVRIGGWSPRNSTRGFAGDVTLTTAFARSINTVAVKLAERSGFRTVADTARRFGLTTRIDTRPAMALGSSEATLLEMTQAYAAIANEGRAVRAFGITRVATGDGVDLWRRLPPDPRVVVSPDVAAKLTRMMKAAVETGTGRAAQMGRELAGKTGTTSSNRDGWFLGFTSDLVAGVWMGRDDARPVPGLGGGQAPARAFALFMGRASRGP
jgi:penicillin-binding protein 1A